MAWSLCTHLGNSKNCNENPGGTDITLCVCTSESYPGKAVVQVKRAHGSTHGRFIAISTPDGYAAAFQFQHDTTSTQDSSTCFSPMFDHPGTYPYKVQVVWSGGTRTVVIQNQGEQCSEQF